MNDNSKGLSENSLSLWASVSTYFRPRANESRIRSLGPSIRSLDFHVWRFGRQSTLPLLYSSIIAQLLETEKFWGGRGNTPGWCNYGFLFPVPATPDVLRRRLKLHRKRSHAYKSRSIRTIWIREEEPVFQCGRKRKRDSATHSCIKASAVGVKSQTISKGEGIIFRRERRQPNNRRAFSLLEVILALAILIGALAVIGELVRSGLRNAQVARDLSQAQLLCETRLAEIHAGAASSEGAGKSPIADHPGWLATVERESSSVQSGSSGSSSGGSGGGSSGGQSAAGGQSFSGQVSLLKVRVTVEQDPSEYLNPVKFSLSQWMIDPSVTGVQLQPPVNPATSGNSQSGSSSSGSSSGQGR